MSKILTETKTLSFVALPLMAAFLAQKGMQVIDTVMLGRISPEALAAGGLSVAVVGALMVFCMGALSVVGIYIARSLGAKEHDDIHTSLINGIYLALLLSIPSFILLWITPTIFLKIGEAPNLVLDSALLLHGWAFGFPGLLLFLVFREFLAAFSLTRIVFVVCLMALPLTWGLNYVWIYGKFGFPAKGIAGVGYAGAFIPWFLFLSLLIYSFYHQLLKPHVLKLSRQKVHFKKIYEMFYISLPTGILFVLDSGMCLMAAVMMGYFGVDALAAHQVAMQCCAVAFSLPFALSVAVSLRVSHTAGAKDFILTRLTIYSAIAIGLVFAGLIMILFVGYPTFLMRVYSIDNVLVKKILFIAAWFQCFDTFLAISSGALRGIKDTWAPMFICVMSYWMIGVLGGYYLAFHTSIGPLGIWYALSAGIFSASVLLSLRFINRFKRVA